MIMAISDHDFLVLGQRFAAGAGAREPHDRIRVVRPEEARPPTIKTANEVLAEP
jgi:hypothetical protein